MHLDFCVYSFQSILQMADNKSEAIIYNLIQIYRVTDMQWYSVFKTNSTLFMQQRVEPGNTEVSLHLRNFLKFRL